MESETTSHSGAVRGCLYVIYTWYMKKSSSKGDFIPFHDLLMSMGAFAAIAYSLLSGMLEDKTVVTMKF